MDRPVVGVVERDGTGPAGAEEAPMQRFVVLVHRLRFARFERAASLVEYALLVALIALACVAAVKFIGDSTTTSLNNSGSSILGT